MEWRKKHLGEPKAKKSGAPPTTTKTVTSGLPRNPPSQSKEPSDSVSMQNSPKPGTSRAEDTSKSRELSLQKKRDDMAKRRSDFKSNATDEQREAQREYERNRKKKQRENETPQQREARLKRMRDYRASNLGSTERRDDKTSPGFSYTGEYDRDQRRIQRERETPQQREDRLQKAREYKATYQRKATPKEKEATRVRVAAARAKWTEEQRAKDREAAIKRMENVRSTRTVDEMNEEKEKQRLRRMGEWNWRRREQERWGEKAEEEKQRKLASGKWKEGERHGFLVPIDPENLEWDCPAGPKCMCHHVRTCKRCKRSFFGCQALCPSKICREREADSAPVVTIPEEMSEYDKIRQKNIEDRERKFKELGLNEAKTTVANSLKVTKKGKSSKK